VLLTESHSCLASFSSSETLDHCKLRYRSTMWQKVDFYNVVSVHFFSHRHWHFNIRNAAKSVAAEARLQ